MPPSESFSINRINSKFKKAVQLIFHLDYKPVLPKIALLITGTPHLKFKIKLPYTL